MSKRKPKIVLIAAGGTISMDKDQRTGKSIPVRTAAELCAQLSIDETAEVRCVDLPEQLRSMQRPEDLPAFAHAIKQEVQNGVDGVVVTQGTDTLEEVVYFIDEVLSLAVPLVFTGAMRPGWAAGFDGIRNLENAIHVAAVVPLEYGTLVTMNDEVFEAWSVYKADTGALDAFSARRGAAFGRVFGDRVEFAWRPLSRTRFGRIPQTLPTAVPILLLGAVDDAVFLDRAGELPVQGIVIAGMAAGSVPPEARKRVLALAESGFPIVLCSGATSGRTAEDYYYPGAYDDLTAAGVVVEDWLSPRKARMRLLLSLGLQVPYVPFGREFVLERFSIA